MNFWDFLIIGSVSIAVVVLGKSVCYTYLMAKGIVTLEQIKKYNDGETTIKTKKSRKGNN